MASDGGFDLLFNPFNPQFIFNVSAAFDGLRWRLSSFILNRAKRNSSFILNRGSASLTTLFP